MRLSEWRAALSVSPRAGSSTARPACLTEAYEAPWGFWKGLGRELLDEAPGTPRSAVFEWYNLFHELGERHAVGGLTALTEFPVATGGTSTSYCALVVRARALAREWGRAGVQPGCTVCICLEPSPAYVSGLLAAWRCGAAISIVPPDGPCFSRVCLESLKETAAAQGDDGQALFVLAGSRARPWLESDPGLTLLEWGASARARQTPAGAERAPHRFAAGEIAARLFSPLSPQWDRVVELSAEQLYLGALRDGLLLLGLGAGRTLAAPGFCSLQYKPALLLSVLACGAHYQEFDLHESSGGRPLLRAGIDLLCVTASVRERLASGLGEGEKAAPKRWLRNLAEDSDFRAWSDFSEKMAARGALGMSYVASSAVGGSLLFSPWCKDPMASGVWATPGLPCELIELNGNRMPAISDVGMLMPLTDPKQTHGIQAGLPEHALGRCVIARGLETDLWIANLGSHRAGQVLPERQMEALLKQRYECVRAAVLAALPSHSSAGKARVALLVFATPSEAPPPDVSRLSNLLTQQFGPARLPDRIELFELNPRWVDPKSDDPEVDRAGCVLQYLTGALWGKARLGVFRELARLSREVRELQAAGSEQAASEADPAVALGGARAGGSAAQSAVTL